MPRSGSKFSLIVGTVERAAELSRLLDSLSRQSRRDFEVIIVDQSGDDRFVPSIEAHRRGGMEIVHLRTDRRGASRARNLGLGSAGGDIIAFPDDDCWYPAGLLEKVADWLAANPEADGLSVRSVDERFVDSVAKWSPQPGWLSRGAIWSQSVEFGMFLRRAVVDGVGGFDETLGVGAGTPWGADEGCDYLLRALALGYAIRYEPRFFVHHPNVLPAFDERAWRRAASYSRGMGRVLRKHRYPMHHVVWLWIRPLGGAVLSLVAGRFGKARYYFHTFAGRFAGWAGR